MEVESYCSQKGISFDTDWATNEAIPVEIRDRVLQYFNSVRSYSARIVDGLRIDGTLEKYIRDNKIPQDRLIKLADRQDVTLFGEVHTLENHTQREIGFILDMDDRGLVFMDEAFPIEKMANILAFMEGDDAALDVLKGSTIYDIKLENTLKFLRARGTPVMPAESEEINNNPVFRSVKCDLREDFIREEIHAEQIRYALRKGYRIFAVLGNMHVYPDATPAFLKKGA